MRRADLGDDRVDDGADGHGVGAEPDEAEGRLDVFDRCGLGDAGEDRDDVEGYDENVESGKEYRAPSEARDEEPGEDRAAEGDAGATETDAVGSVAVNASLFEEAVWVRMHGNEGWRRVAY